MTDPIADMLTRIRNSLAVSKKQVFIPYSKIKWGIAQILKKEGYISDMSQKNNLIKIELKYYKSKPIISGIRRISKPGQRIYVKKEKLPRVKNDFGLAIISTSSGILTNKQARKKGLGGEVICEIW